MKKGIKILLWAVGIVLALVIVVSLLAGPIAKGYINRHGEDLTGRVVHVDHVGVNLFSGNVNLRGLDVYEDDAETVFAGFDTLDVSVHLLKIPFHTLHFSHITLAGLHAAVEQNGDRFNFSSLIEHFASDDTTADQDTTPSDWTLKFYNIRISHARLDYDDAITRKGVHLPDVNLRVPGFVLGGKEASEGGLGIGFDRGGHLGVDGSFDASSNTFALKVDLDAFSIDNLDTYLSDLLRYDRLGGTLDAHLVAEGNLDHVMQTSIAGTVAVRNLDLADSRAPIAGFESLDVEVDNINLDENLFDIASVRLSGLNVLYEQWKDHSNIGRLTTTADAQPVTLGTQPAEPAAPADTTPAAPAKPMQLHVGSLLVENASVTYADNTLPDPFRFPVTKLNVKASDLTTTGNNGATVEAVLPGGGRLNVVWHGDIGEWKRHQDLFLTVRGLDMKQLSPWTVAYTGQPIEDGILSLTSHNIIASSRLVGKNSVDIYKARVGDRRTDVEPEMKLPLKAALYVLRDKDDKILIDLPVNGDIDNPEFSYMKIVWKTLGNLLVKVATSPVRALGNALGMGGENLEFVAVDATRPAFTSEHYHTLSSLATIARQDSLISFTFERRFKPETDSAAVATLDVQLHNYLLEQGLPESRFKIVDGAPVTEAKQPSGYAITSEVEIEEE